MQSVPTRKKRLESTISICLLSVLLITAIVILLKQSDADVSRFGINTPAPKNLDYPEPIQQEKLDLDTFVPQGFIIPSKAQIYTKESLYEKINGKAPFYTEAGFENLLTQRFVSKENENLWMELFLYDMGNVRNAFSVFSTQRRPDADILSLLHSP